MSHTYTRLPQAGSSLLKGDADPARPRERNLGDEDHPIESYIFIITENQAVIKAFIEPRTRPVKRLPWYSIINEPLR